ncbi:MAG: hypothetical protein WA139_02940 [Candidatus Aenigmatarchaeota archaeon]
MKNIAMKNPNYWKSHYVVETDAEEIERNIRLTSFSSGDKNFGLVCFEKGKRAPNILISPGSGGHSYVFAELGYLMHKKGYNVFIMPRHGSATINELMQRHEDALEHIANNFNENIGVFAEGLGSYAVFYLALAHGPMKSMVLQNGPAILTEDEFQKAFSEGGGAARRRKLILPFAKFLAKIFPSLPVPISLYLDYKDLIDTKEENRKLETRLVKEGYLKDPDFNKWNALSAIMSLVLTPPPNPLSELKTPVMFIVPARGIYPSYEKDLFGRLPAVKKKLAEVDGSVFWMVSHPKEAAKIICKRFDETL